MNRIEMKKDKIIIPVSAALNLFRHRISDEESGEKILVDFWDTAGQEKFQSMHPSYYHQVGL